MEGVDALDTLEDQRTSFEVLGWGVGKFLSTEVLFGFSDIARGLDKGRKLRVGYFGFIHPEALDLDIMGRALFLVFVVDVDGAHPEFPTRNPDHLADIGWVDGGCTAHPVEEADGQ